MKPQMNPKHATKRAERTLWPLSNQEPFPCTGRSIQPLLS